MSDLSSETAFHYTLPLVMDQDYLIQWVKVKVPDEHQVKGWSSGEPAMCNCDHRLEGMRDYIDHLNFRMAP